ncbi:MAG: DUF4397 domain-containing protein, partial [Ktedonobacterales bacterium]|nr:DUF4397 domain-containing protein [Ktedonobacterales bacterium]
RCVAALMCVLALGLTLGQSAAHAAGTGHVRVVHAAPAAPEVDVYVDGAKALPDFKFGTVTDYISLPAGPHEIAVVPFGMDISKAVIKQSVTVADGKLYTVAAIGNTNPAVTPALVAFADDNTVVPDKAKVRVYHLSDNAGPVAVATGGNTVIPNLAFQSASDYLHVPAGAYIFDVTLLNTSTKVSQPATLAANKVTSVFALGEVGGTGATVFKFAVGVADGIPNGQPQTGVAPTATTTGLPVALWFGLGALALVALGGLGFAVTRRAR